MGRVTGDPRIKIEGFEGSVEDLLLRVTRGEHDPTDVCLDAILDQGLPHLGSGEKLDLGAAAAFLVAALRLLDRKAAALLPGDGGTQPEEPAAETDPEDSAVQLVEHLMQYRGFKEAAGVLRRFEEEHRHCFARPGEDVRSPRDTGLEGVTLDDLLAALGRIWDRLDPAAPDEIAREEITVAARVRDLVQGLRQAGGESSFSAFFSGRTTRLEVVVTFLALLELIRLRRVTVRQNAAFGEIWIYLCPRGVAGDGIAG